MTERLFDLNVEILGETDKAVKVLGDDGEPIWLPKSQIEIEYQNVGGEVVMRNKSRAVITMPEWLAVDKGFT